MALKGARFIGVFAIVIALLAVGCGGTGGTASAIVVSGSSTVEPISTGVAEAFANENPGFEYTIEGPGTGDGFQRFCAGETDISDASRLIKDEEKIGRAHV